MKRIAVLLSLLAAMPAFAADDAKLIEGAWLMHSIEVDGQARDLSDNPPRWIIKGNKIRYAGAELADLAINGSATPKTIDVTYANPKKVYEGIYSLDADTLKICINRQTDGVKERPDDFTTANKSEWRLLVFQRDKAAPADETTGAAGYVGMQIRADKEPKQLVIADVVDKSPAQKAGLKKDDVLLKVGGTEPTDLQAVIKTVQQFKPGSEIVIRVKRGAAEKDVTVKTTTLPFFYLD